MPTTILQTLNEGVATIEGHRTPQGTVALSLRDFEGKQSLLSEHNVVGCKRAFMEALTMPDFRANVARKLREAQDRYDWQRTVQDAEAQLDLEATAEALGIDLSDPQPFGA